MRVFRETILYSILTFLLVTFAVGLVQSVNIKQEILKNQSLLTSIRQCQINK